MTQLCKICGQAPAHTRRRCKACYSYWQRTRRERPRELWTPVCLNCGTPREEGQQFQRGRCSPCYNYRKKLRRERPRELWKPSYSPTRYCDCGQAATTAITVKYGIRGHLTMRLDLCDECHRLELEMQAELQARGVELVAA